MHLIISYLGTIATSNNGDYCGKLATATQHQDENLDVYLLAKFMSDTPLYLLNCYL